MRKAQEVESSRLASTGAVHDDAWQAIKVAIYLQEVSKAQEEEVSRLTDELDLLLQRRQQLQEALAAAQQV